MYAASLHSDPTLVQLIFAGMLSSAEQHAAPERHMPLRYGIMNSLVASDEDFMSM